MKWIGLTGGIGTGKSSVAELLRQRGYPVVDADQLARDAVAKNSSGLKAVLKEFGQDLQTLDGELDRGKMAERVFRSKENLLKLESILHPIVRQLAAEAKAKLASQKMSAAFYDVPLLFEKNMESMFDVIVVVSANSANQIARLKKRTKWTDDQIRERIANQKSLEEKVKAAHFVVHNDGTQEDLSNAVDELLTKLKL